MFRILKIGSAFIGIIVGAGLASGQEILQYFTSFGHLGTLAAILSTALFTYMGMILMRLGSRMQTVSHKDVIYRISGRYLGVVVDGVIIFTLFGVGVVMLAGAGSLLHQQFDLPVYVGSILISILIILTVMLNVEKVVAVIGSITPFLIITVIIVGVYSLFTMDASFNDLNPVAQDVKTTLPNWFISSINYVSFNIAVGAAMTLVMGGTQKDEKIATLGGLVGGLGLGFIIILSHLAIFSKVDVVAAYDMPMLRIVHDISPTLSIIYSFVLFGMIFNTGVSMFYAFVARFFKMNTKSSNIAIVVVCTVGIVLSFVGFTELVAFFYNLIGYLGLVLMVVLIYASFNMSKYAEGPKNQGVFEDR